MTDFQQLSLAPALLQGLERLGYTQTTPIQNAALPAILSGRDLIARAPTGSGKTAAFGLGLLQRLDPAQRTVQALVLCPTRELAGQVAQTIRRLASGLPNVTLLSLCGGSSLAPQTTALQHGAHIVVGTPGRIQKHLQKGSLDLGALRTLVLDEADRMLDMGFIDAIAAIAEQAPAARQTLLFSATYPEAIARLSARFQREPLEVFTASPADRPAIEQHCFETTEDERGGALLRLLAHYQPERALIFCNTKRRCDEVAALLNGHGHRALAQHGDLEQRERNDVLVQFANHSINLLVASDVAARGLDIDDLPVVINYELSPDPQVHTHRIGRTGRAGRRGLALSLFTAAEAHRLAAIETLAGSPCQRAALDSLAPSGDEPPRAAMTTLQIGGGRKDKLRPGDILGALTREGGIDGGQIGKIDIFDRHSCVAVAHKVADNAQRQLAAGRIKGRKFKVRRLA